MKNSVREKLATFDSPMTSLQKNKPGKIPAAQLKYMVWGTGLFFLYQYISAFCRLSEKTSAMDNKFSALAKKEYLWFLVRENIYIILAYIILALVAALVIQPLANWLSKRFRFSKWSVVFLSLFLTVIGHHYFAIRLMDTRPYFLPQEISSQWYFHIFEFLPASVKPAFQLCIFQVLPVICGIAAAVWHLARFNKRGWKIAGVVFSICLIYYGILQINFRRTHIIAKQSNTPNIIIIGSDSLRADRLGSAGYTPIHQNGAGTAGVSPIIDELAKRSVNFQNCYSPIASTLESGIGLMSAEYPQTHGIRQMYPDEATVVAAKQQIIPMARLLREKGYDTAAIGDWCAGYYQVMPLDFEHIEVSNFDNFKVYMSQAVMMAHFVVPLYFDNALGYKIFPQISSFAQFVTPEVVTKRVEDRLAKVAKSGQPFFWHVFYSCNHLPYSNPEPYRSMFTNPAYNGPNRNRVEFDINSFISKTDLESKWKQLPLEEINQIRGLYDGCTRQFDDCVGHILTSLKANGLADNTIVIITADHGDDQFEQGVTLGHGLTFNGALEANHVPMIFYVPGAKPVRIPEIVRLIDVIPTLADLTGVEKPKIWQGQSFAAWIKEIEKPIYRPFYGETGFPFIQFSVPGIIRPSLPPMDELTYIDKNFNYQFVLKEEYKKPLLAAKQRCLRTRFWKLVCTPTIAGERHFALFHLPQDPNGEHDVAATTPEILLPLRLALERWMDENQETSIQEMFPAGEQ